MLIIGGGERWRLQVAESFHREGPMRHGVLLRVDGRVEEEQLVRTLYGPAEAWALSGAERLRTAPHGTLFVDWVTRLTPAAQRLLLTRACRSVEVPADGEGWVGGLVVGSRTDPADAVDAGSFSRDLYDAVDKIRVEAGGPTAPAARGSRVPETPGAPRIVPAYRLASA